MTGGWSRSISSLFKTQCLEWRSRSSCPVVFLHVAETLMFLPIPASRIDLLAGACDEIPPHDNGFLKGKPADQNRACAFFGIQRDRFALHAGVVQNIAIQRVSVERDPPVHN